jgi:hypothetical protein
MPQVISKFVLVLEALPLAYLTFWLLFLCVAFFTSGSIRDVQASAFVLLYFAALAAVVAAWRVMLRFWADGADGLRSLHRVWWGLSVTGAAIAAGSFAVCRIPGVLELRFSSSFVWGLQFLQYGVCFLVPLVHLWLEYLFRLGANYRLDRP